MHLLDIVKSEDGSAILVALLILVMLTIFGISSNSNSNIDIQIVRSERDYVQEFYVADSGWKDGANWLDGMSNPPFIVNATGQIVRNFGNQPAGSPDNIFPDGTQDNTISGVPYWYRATYNSDAAVPGSGPEYRSFVYTVTSNANKIQEIDVFLSKIYKIGY
jgi:hypothetical protein